MTPESRMADHMTFLYGSEQSPKLLESLQAMLQEFCQRNPHLSTAKGGSILANRLTQRDVVLITYGDQVREPGKPPLKTLAEVLEEYVGEAITNVHLLPFFPYSSDDGFSVTDYTAVDPALGAWDDIERLGHNFGLMFDAVVNHISAQSRWFREFLEGNPAFADHFIIVEEGTDISRVVRPRAFPLLTRLQTAHGENLVWTTFSPDQVDLNYANPEVLLKIIQVLLFYVEKGAEIIRLDAIAYLWKKIGTPCIHLPETHRLVKLFRAVLDAVAPHVILITETNVPHQENVAYFGDGTDEAQMVYQFSLPPLVLHTLYTGDATRLSTWVGELNLPSIATTFFNFLASHDGIGVWPVECILTPSEVQALVERTLAHGGHVSYKTNVDGSRSVYELNISYFDALSAPGGAEPLELQARRFLVSQAIMLSLAGVPGIYVHSLFGSRSYHAGVEQAGHYRAINREKFLRVALEQDLTDPASLRRCVFDAYLHLIRTRIAHPAFHPSGPQRVVSIGPGLFSLLRTSLDGGETILCIHNVSNQAQPVQVNLGALSFPHAGQVHDLIAGTIFPVVATGALNVQVAPYQALWLNVKG